MKNRNGMKALLAATLCASMVFPLGGAVETKAEAQEEVAITVYSEWVGAHPSAPFFSQRLEEFEEAYPNIKVNVENLAGSSTANMDAKLKVQISAGELPDVFYSNDRSIIELAKNEGLLYDMKEFFDKDTDYQKDLAEGNIESWNGGTEHVYNIASGQDVFGFYYNKEMLSSVGYDKFPETWEDFWECCDKLKEKGIQPISMETKTAWQSSLTWFLLTAAQGPQGEALVNTMGVEDYTAPELVKGAQELQKIFQEYTTPDAPGSDCDVAINHFLNEETAMIIDGAWRIAQFKTPENTTEGFADKLGVAMVPGNGAIVYPGFAYSCGSSDPQKAEAAYEFIKFFTNADAQKLDATITGMIPSSSRIDLETFLSDVDPLQKEILSFLNEKEYSVISPWRVYPSSVTAVIMQEMAALATGQETPQEFTQSLTKAAQK